MKRTIICCVATAAMLTLAGTSQAQIKIGVTVSATGPAASLGIPEKNTVAMCPRTIAGKSVEYIVLDDASDTTLAVQNAKKLISESAVDAIIGSTTTPNSLAMTDVVAEGETPTISLASSVRIIEPVDAKKAWVFKTPQTDVMMAGAILEGKTQCKDAWLRRLQRRAGRGVLRRDRQGRRGTQDSADRQRAFLTQGHQRHRAGMEAHRFQAGRHRHRRFRNARGAARAHAHRARLQGQAVFQSRCGQQRFSAGRRQGCRGRIRAGQPGHRIRSVARRSPGQETRPGVRA